jgi:hypothetical protein
VVVLVRLVRSGGLGGLDMVATLDSSDLPTDQQDVVSRLLTEDLRGPGIRRPGGADQFSYQLEIQHGECRVRRHWEEPEVHEAVWPLLAALTRRAKPAR